MQDGTNVAELRSMPTSRSTSWHCVRQDALHRDRLAIAELRSIRRMANAELKSISGVPRINAMEEHVDLRKHACQVSLLEKDTHILLSMEGPVGRQL